MDIAAALRTFAAVFPAELPDKTMLATLVLVAHHRRALAVWCGAATAFTVHVALAVAAGQALSLLPGTAITLVTATLFGVGAVVLWRGSAEPVTGGSGDGDGDGATGGGEGGEAGGGEAGGGEAVASTTTALAAFAGSFGVVLLAEAGDLTQIATASIAASSGAPLAVAAGALAALWLVAALAATLGRRLASRLPIRTLRRAAAGVFATLAVIALVTLL